MSEVAQSDSAEYILEHIRVSSASVSVSSVNSVTV